MAQHALITMFAHPNPGGQADQGPSNPKGRKYRMIELPAMAALKTELYMAFQASGMRKAELARRCGISPKPPSTGVRFRQPTRLEPDQRPRACSGSDCSRSERRRLIAVRGQERPDNVTTGTRSRTRAFSNLLK